MFSNLSMMRKNYEWNLLLYNKLKKIKTRSAEKQMQLLSFTNKKIINRERGTKCNSIRTKCYNKHESAGHFLHLRNHIHPKHTYKINVI